MRALSRDVFQREQETHTFKCGIEKKDAVFLALCVFDWGQSAEITFQTIFPHLVVLFLLQDIEHLREQILSQGIDIKISRCKM